MTAYGIAHKADYLRPAHAPNPNAPRFGASLLSIDPRVVG